MFEDLLYSFPKQQQCINKTPHEQKQIDEENTRQKNISKIFQSLKVTGVETKLVKKKQQVLPAKYF